MPILAKFEKQPADSLDYDVDFREWLEDGDVIVAADASVEPAGLVIEFVMIVNNVVRVFLSGGTDGVKYKVTVTIQTSTQRVKQVEFLIKVKEV